MENAETEYEAPLPRNNGAKTRRIDLGLAILSAISKPGATYEPEEIAGFCDCTPSLIISIEARALRKMRNKLFAQFNIGNADADALRRALALHRLS